MARLTPLLALLVFPAVLFAQQGTVSRTSSLTSPTLIILKGEPDFERGYYPIKEYLDVLVDSSGAMDFGEVSSEDLASNFRPLSGFSTLDLSLNREVFWLRLKTQNQLKSERIWLANFMEARITFYGSPENPEPGTPVNGVLIPASGKYFGNQFGQVPVLPVVLPATGNHTFYWRVESQPTLVESEHGIDLNYSLLSPAHLSKYLQTEAFIIALSIGFMLAVGIYHLIIFFYIRERNYLLFFLFCLVSPIALIINLGYDLQYFWPEWPFAHYYYFRAFGLILQSLVFILFSRSFLEMPKYTPQLEKVLWGIFGMIAIGFGVGTHLLWSDPFMGLPLVRLGQNGFILSSLLLIVIPIICIRKGHKPARLYLLANLTLLLGFILAILNTYQVLPRIRHVSWAQIGTSLQLCLFALGMAQLFRQYQQRRQVAQMEALRLKELDEAKSRLFNNITHEFRTPLTIISGMAEQIEVPPDAREMIRRNSQRLLQLVNQMLGLAKTETGNMPLAMIRADVVAFLKYLKDSFDSYADTKQISLHFQSEKQKWELDFDEEKLQTIVSNLLSNAIKFSPNGSVVNMEVLEEAQQGTKHLVLKVTDNGIGIPEDKLPYVFDSFYQVDDSQTRQSEGTGLGLTFTKALVELLGGHITVKSTPGAGSSFIVRLPVTHQAIFKEVDWAVQPEHWLPQNAIQEEKVAFEPDEDKLLVLVIEDSPDVIAYIRTCLPEAYQVVAAENGQIGIEKALELIPDIIISDVMMPLKDGYEVCAQLKNDERTSHIPIVLLTAKSDMESRIEGLDHGADAYLAKPFDKKELLVRLEQLILLRKRLQEQFASGNFIGSSGTTNRREDIFLRKVRGIVEEHLSDADFGLEEICRELLLSRSQLHRKLKALTNKPTSRIIRSIRLQNGKKLLETTDLNVSEVAYDTGFKDPNHFSRVFKEEFGISPSEIR